jgi:phosphate transport system substrate-binding protein
MRTFLFLSVLLFAACQSQNEKLKLNTSILENVNRGTFKLYADSNTAYILNQVKDCYRASFPEANLDIHYTHSDDAYQAVLKDSARLLVLDRMLTKNEWQDLYVAYQTRPLEHVFAYDAIALVKPKQEGHTVLNWEQFKNSVKSGSSKFITLKIYEELVQQMAKIAGVTSGGMNIKVAANVSELDAFLKTDNSYLGVLPFSLVSDQDSPSARELAKIFHWQGFEIKIEGKIDTIFPSQSTIRTEEYPLIKPYNIIACEVTREKGIGLINFCFKREIGKLVLKAGLIPKVMPERAILLQEGNL